MVNIEKVPIEAVPLRKSEPSICAKMRSYVETQIKPVYEMVLADVRQIGSRLAEARSPNIENIAFDARNAIQRVYGELADISNSSLAYINGNCSFLNTTGVLNLTIQGLENWRQTQLATAVKLADIPHSYEANMQGNYAKIEKIIGTNF